MGQLHDVEPYMYIQVRLHIQLVLLFVPTAHKEVNKDNTECRKKKFK